MRKSAIAVSVTAAILFFSGQCFAEDDVAIDWDKIEKQAITVHPKENADIADKKESGEKKLKPIGQIKEQKNEKELPAVGEIDENSLPKAKAENEEIIAKAFSLKNYTNVRYSKRLTKLSLYKNGKEVYEKVKEMMGVSDFVEPTLLERYWTPKGTVLSAFYFDHIKHKPNIAENFYKRFDDVRAPFYVKGVLRADYYLRTRRPKKILKILPRASCFANFKYMIPCLYYRGIAKYIITGNNKNPEICQAANNGLQIARKICYGY